MPVREIVDDLDKLLPILPPHIREQLENAPNLHELLEVVLDLGRPPEARFTTNYVFLSNEPVTREDLEYVVNHIGEFGRDNRAGIEGTLHRISCMRNRQGRIVGLTCRVGRAVFGTIDIIRDVVESGKNILLLGPPGLGKTTKLREIARVLADEFGKRVIVVDTSNEIGGDGDVPHPAIGHARRMQVPTPDRQHDVMIEAVENHMPEVIIIDEIGRPEEAYAARTIAERGVQLIATAHGNTLENLLSSPMLSDLVGGVQVVTLSDEEARRRGTQKTILERKHAPTFDIVIEMIEREKLAIHFDVASAVDALLRGQSPRPEMREEHPDGKISIWVASEQTRIPDDGERGDERRHWNEDAQHEVVKIYAYGVSRKNILRVAQKLNISIELVPRWQDADVVLTVRSHLRKGRGDLPTAIERGKPVYALRSNTYSQLERQMRELFSPMLTPEEELAIREAEEAINIALNENRPVELSPCAAHLRRLQHEVAQKYQLISESIGDEPMRRVIIYPNDR